MKPDFSDLRGALPPLHFDPSRDPDPRDAPRSRAYLDHYRLDLSGDYPDVCHRFGQVRLDDWELAVHYWLPEKPSGSLTIVHGYFDHSALYGSAIRFGLERGLAVLVYDQPGHGLSSGQRLAIDSFDRYGDVLEHLLQRASGLLPGPRHTLAQSMGGGVALNNLWRHGSELAGRTALFAPLILPRGWGLARWLYALVKPWLERVPRRIADSTHDPGFNRFLAERDGLQERFVSVQWLGAMKAWDQAFRSFPVRGEELLVVQGTGDDTVNWRYNLAQIRRKLPRAQVAMIEGAGHHLVNESDPYRQAAFAAVERFFFEKSAEGVAENGERETLKSPGVGDSATPGTTG